MKEISKEQVADLFANALGLLTDTEEEIVTTAAKVAAAREKGTSDKRYLSKLDSICDNYKDQLITTTMDLVSDSLDGMLENAGMKEEYDDYMNLLNEFSDIVMDWYKKTLIKGSEIAINTVLHPERAKADKKEMRNLGVEFNSAVYNFIQTVISSVIKFIGGEEDLAQADPELKDNLNYFLEVAEDKVTDLSSEKSGKKKTNPIVRDPDEVKKMAKETESKMEEISNADVEPTNFGEEFGAQHQGFRRGAGYGEPKKSFVEMSSFFNA